MEVFPESGLHGREFFVLTKQVVEDAENAGASAYRPWGAAWTWTGKLMARHGLFILNKPPFRLPEPYMNDRSVSRSQLFGG